MKKIFRMFNMKGLICIFAVLILSIGTFLVLNPDLGAQAYEKIFRGNILIGGKVQVIGVGLEDMRIGLGNAATECRIDSPGSPLLCAGLAGVQETTAAGGVLTEGYVSIREAADFLRFSVQLPDTWLDWGAVGNLEFEFDVVEMATGAVIDVRIWDQSSTTAIVSDQITLTDGTARAMTNLDTLSTGIGALAAIGPADTLIFEITGVTNADDFDIYGIHMIYNPGLERVATEANR